MKKYIFLMVALLSLTNAYLFAQGSDDEPVVDTVSVRVIQARNAHELGKLALVNNPLKYGGNSIYEYDARTKEIEGHPYMFEQNKAGIIKMRNGDLIEGIKFRYNTSEDVVEYSHEGTSINLYSHLIEYFIINDPEKGPRKFKNGYEIGMGDFTLLNFFEVIYESDDMQLLAYHKKQLKETEIQESPGMFKKLTSYRADKVKYILIEKGNTRRLKLTKGALIEALYIKGNRVKGFIKDNKLSCKSEEDLKRVIEYYDSI